MGGEYLPLYVSIKDRYLLNQPQSLKETYHIILDLSNIPLEYEVGDCIGIYPSNDPLYVSQILEILKAPDDEIVLDREQNPHLFRSFLEKKANLARVNKKLLELVRTKIALSSEKIFLDRLLTEKDPLRQYMEEKQVLDVLRDFSVASLSPQELCNQLPPLMPRFYSIASSRYAVGNELHLTVGVTKYQSNDTQRVGVCSHFLCYQAPLHKPVIPIFLQKARDFVLSEKALHSPLIMIGPGTGVAPFRGFMQERILKSTCDKNWLFFGERNRAYDFYYEEFWSSLVAQKKLTLDTAFSRDQPNKIYVQHKMMEQASTLWNWIEEGAFLYVCGDASRMAKDVEATLHSIIQEQGGKSIQESILYLKELRSQKRYLRDVY